jgi:heme a synthase
MLQAGIGIAQYQLGVPIQLVALHLLGASLAIAAVTNLVLSVSRQPAFRASESLSVSRF